MKSKQTKEKNACMDCDKLGTKECPHAFWLEDFELNKSHCPKIMK